MWVLRRRNAARTLHRLRFARVDIFGQTHPLETMLIGELYPQIKWAHVSCVVLSGGLFALRAAFAVTGSAYANHAMLRRLSYAIDTTLLAAALLLASIIHQWPFVQPWLTTKVLLLLAYIALGLITLRLGKTRPIRLACFVAALIVYSFIISVAITHDSRGLFLLFV
jgi:uncharacterized membrane protein SirB2